MFSQRGKASTKASNTKRQANKSQTNVRKQKQKKKGISLNVRDLNLNANFQERDAVANSYSQGVSTQSARVIRSGNQSCRIVHREQIDTVAGHTGFYIDSSWNINPGLSDSFPWLSIQASGWEKYRFNSLKLCYYPRCSTLTVGSIMMAPDYDSADSPPSSEQIAASFLGAVEDAPWKTTTLNFNSSQLSRDRFIRSGALAPNLDIRNTDVANAYVIVSDGATDGAGWGKLWIEYDVTLINQTNTSLSENQNGITSVGVAPAVGTTNIFGTQTFSQRGLIVTTNGSVVSISGMIPGERYIMNAFVVGTSIVTANISAVTGLTGYVTLGNFIIGGNTQSTNCMIYTASSSSGTITFSYSLGTIATSIFTFARNKTFTF